MPFGPPKLFRTWPTVASPQAQQRLDDDAEMMMWLMGLARQGKAGEGEDKTPEGIWEQEPQPQTYMQGGLGAGADWRDAFSTAAFDKPLPFGEGANQSPKTGAESEGGQPAGGHEPSAGQIVVLPDGSRVPDSKSPTGFMMSPVADLGHVAAAGRETAFTSLTQAFNPETAGGASISPYISLFAHLHQGGAFDYQREGNPITGFKQMPQFRAVSNFNIGLFAQQVGFSLGETLSMAGLYARTFSRNASPDKPYGLDAHNTEFIKAGYDAGKSGLFGPAPAP